jgi:hypothetical protein
LELSEGETLVIVNGPRVHSHTVRYGVHDGDDAQVDITILMVECGKPRVGPGDSEVAEYHLIVKLGEVLIGGGLHGQGDGLRSLLVLRNNVDH